MGQYLAKQELGFYVNSVKLEEDGGVCWRTTITMCTESQIFGRKVVDLPKRVRAENFEATRKGVREVLDEHGFEKIHEEEYLDNLQTAFEDARNHMLAWRGSPILKK